MTTGEKIQFYRKKSGLSQEELGQKLLVSRQTISLWEMNKTLPTVDNLIRLREIFSVSIDDMLSDAELTEEKEFCPKESYVFEYEEKEWQEVFKNIRLSLIRRGIGFVLGCFILLIVISALTEGNALFDLVFSILLIGLILRIKGYIAFQKSWKSGKSRFLQNVYSYEVFEGYFVLNISRNEEITEKQKIDFEDVKKIYSYGNYLVLSILGRNYILKKDALVPDSVFNILCKNKPEKGGNEKNGDFLNTVSILLFVLSICTIWGAMVSISGASPINQIFIENMWIFFLFLPVPIASIVFGFYLKRKGYKYKKNVIVGFIMGTLLCVYGSFTFIFSGLYSHSDEPILLAEQILNIDIPTHSHINTNDWTTGTQSVPRGYIFSTSDIYFTDSAVAEFENGLANDPKWMAEVPSELIGVTSYFFDHQEFDYCIVYNKDTGEFNRLPGESGKYVFINALYDAERNIMKLVEYQIEYTK